MNEILVSTITEHFEEFGLKLNIKENNRNQFANETLALRNFDLLLTEIEVESEKDLYNFWHSSSSNYPLLNISGYTYTRADRELEALIDSNGTDTEALNQFANYFVQEQPSVVLYDVMNSVIYDDQVPFWLEDDVEENADVTMLENYSDRFTL